MRRRELILATAGAALAACAAPITAMNPPPPTAAPTAADPMLAMPLRGVWPPLYRQASQSARDAYSWAVDRQAELRFIPCFCGCGSSGHDNNWDCFVKEQTGPNTFILDPHAFGCGVCVDVALDAKALLASGQPLKAVRAAIDAKWKTAGPSTRTPYPDD